METTVIISIISVIVAAFTSCWTVITFAVNRKTNQLIAEKERERMLAAEAEKNMRERIDKNHSFAMKAVDDVDLYNKAMELRLRAVEAHQISKGEVQSMLSPVEHDVTELKESIRVGFKEIREETRAYQQTNEATTKTLLGEVSKISGFLLGKESK